PRLDLQADLPGQRAVVGVGQRLRLIMIDGPGQPLGQPAAVGEHQGRLVSRDHAAERLGERRPDLHPGVGRVPGRGREAHGEGEAL
ncbi:hypothetical protein DF186_19545, partial [Enterococcus hirae]